MGQTQCIILRELDLLASPYCPAALCPLPAVCPSLACSPVSSPCFSCSTSFHSLDSLPICDPSSFRLLLPLPSIHHAAPFRFYGFPSVFTSLPSALLLTICLSPPHLRPLHLPGSFPLCHSKVSNLFMALCSAPLISICLSPSLHLGPPVTAQR